MSRTSDVEGNPKERVRLRIIGGLVLQLIGIVATLVSFGPGKLALCGSFLLYVVGLGLGLGPVLIGKVDAPFLRKVTSVYVALLALVVVVATLGVLGVIGKPHGALAALISGIFLAGSVVLTYFAARKV